MKESDGCKNQVMGSQQKDERWLQKREENKLMPKSGHKKYQKMMKIEVKEGSQLREKLAAK